MRKGVFLKSIIWAFALFFVLVLRHEKPDTQISRPGKISRAGFRADRPYEVGNATGENLQSRFEYEWLRLRDPRTGEIPRDIRRRELELAKTLPSRERLPAKAAKAIYAAPWQFTGPINIGGRTRALAIDLDFNGTTNRRILAGGVSGGIYLSEDGGASWTLTTSLNNLPSVTALAQDPNNRNVWYYGTGEFEGTGGRMIGKFLGRGIFKSTDGGKTWFQLPSTIQDNKPNVFDDFFDYTWTIAVHPQTSHVFAAIYGQIVRSTDGGASWQKVLGRTQGPTYSMYTDVAIASDGTIYAALSRNGGSFEEYGIFQSANGGDQWINITPAGLSADPYRMVLGTAPSDPGTVYLLVQANKSGKTAGDHQWFRYNARTNTWTDLSANLPNEPGAEENGSFSSQGGWDLMVAVKPDNPDVVWIGGVNLYRSMDGGRTFERVGGYAEPETYKLYKNHHPDQHAMAFYPNNPNAAISAHDGGLSATTNVLESPQSWVSLNNGYITTQFYTIAADPLPGRNFILGGMQDNGTWGTISLDYRNKWFNLGSGDGAFAAVTPGGKSFYVSRQNGFIIRATRINDQSLFTLVTPAEAENFLFITPFVLDPNDPRVMYVAAGNRIWRNADLTQIPMENWQPTQINWSALDASAAPPDMVITALNVTRNPADRLYFSAIGNNKTRVWRVDNAAGNPPGAEITPPDIVGGSYVSCIALHPENGDEILLTISSYSVPRLWHSLDGGRTWQNVDGNLAGEDGPSIRWAIIAPGVGYFLGTSVGVFSTGQLNGNDTRWIQEGESVLGNVVAEMLFYRPEDGLLLAATHGRGVYSARLKSAGAAVAAVNVRQLSIEAAPESAGSAQFLLSNLGDRVLNYTITATADFGTNQRSRRDSPPAQSTPFLSPAPVSESLAGKILRSWSSSSGASRPEKALHRARESGRTALYADDFDVLYLDDGDNTPDYFLGYGDGTDFVWANRFVLSDSDFELHAMAVYMRTENALFNQIYAAALNSRFHILSEGNVSLPLSPEGTWYTLTFNPPLTFSAPDTFILAVAASGVIGYPAGADEDARVPNHSFYLDRDTGEFVNLNTVPDYSGAAFLIRAIGWLSTSTPLPRISVEPDSGSLAPGASQNILVTFNAGGLAAGVYQGQIRISSNGGELSIPLTMRVTQPVAVDDRNTGQPVEFRLFQNYPNPFNPETTIQYTLNAPALVTLRIYDIQGRLIRELEGRQKKPAGLYRVVWDGKDLRGREAAAGIYFYRLIATDRSGRRHIATRKMSLVR